MEKQIQNYRGISQAYIVNVLEGDGKENPYTVVRYILEINNGKIKTTGKISELSSDENNWLGATNNFSI